MDGIVALSRRLHNHADIIKTEGMLAGVRFVESIVWLGRSFCLEEDEIALLLANRVAVKQDLDRFEVVFVHLRVCAERVPLDAITALDVDDISHGDVKTTFSWLISTKEKRISTDERGCRMKQRQL